MEPIYQTNFTITERDVDCYGRLKPSMILFYAQQVAGMHSTELTVGYDVLKDKRMFWAVIRHRVQVTRMTKLGETIRVETWPMPTTRVAYPRSVVAYDAQGSECFRSISLWVLMDMDTRNMILPGKSGITVSGALRGTELAIPQSLAPGRLRNSRERTVCYTDLDRNGHMNNTRCLDWVDDLLPSEFHGLHRVREFTVCYYSEGKEGQELTLRWDFPQSGMLQADSYRREGSTENRVFALRITYDDRVL